jgi:hypothetical protein
MTDRSIGTVNAEDAVRRYLIMLTDPDSLRDEVAVRQLREKLELATDPLEKLSLYGAIERASNVDTRGIREDFHRHARVFAETHGVGPGAFTAMGVPREDLRAAGLLGASSRPEKRSTEKPYRTRKRLTLEDVNAAIPSAAFTLKELEEILGASPSTVKKAVDALLAEGSLRRIEADPDHAGPGRAPRRYVRS